MQSSLRKDYFWNTLGVFLQNATSPILLVIVTRINGIGESGLFSFAFSVAIILWMFGMWGGRTYQVSDTKKEFSHRSYIMVRLLLSVVMLGVAITFCILNGYDFIKSSVIIALVMLKAVESVADAIQGVLQMHGRLYIAGRALVYKFILGLLAFGFINFFTQDILLATLGLAVVTLIWTVLYDLREAQVFETVKLTSGQISKTAHTALTIMKRTWPVFIVFFLTMFTLNIPRYFIDVYQSQDIGYFGIIAMPITLVVLFATFILQPNIVRLSNAIAESNYRDFTYAIHKVLVGVLVVGVGILVSAELLGVWALEVVFAVQFDNYKTALMIMVVGGIMNALVAVFVHIFTILRHFKAPFYTLVLTNLLLVIVGGGIIKQFGINASAMLFAGVCVVQACVLFVAYILLMSRLKKAASSQSSNLL